MLGGTLLAAGAAGWFCHGAHPLRAEEPSSMRSHDVSVATQEIAERTIGGDRVPEEATQINPRSPAYDPVRIGTVLDLRVRQLFEREPRAAAWADRVEADERAQMEALRDVFPSIRVEEVECRTASCRTVVSVSPADLTDMVEYVQIFVPVGEIVSFDVLDAGDGTDRAHVAWFGSFSPQYRDIAALRSEHQRRFPEMSREREEWLARREQRREVP